MFGAIDLGGTKIEACLFDQALQAVSKKRIATPHTSYEDLLDAIAEQCDWLMQRANDRRLPIGMGIPGLIDRRTGLSTTANLQAMNHPFQADLSARLGRPMTVENDCKCFALSEARGGAGDGYPVVFGLILGTGVGGGVCRQGQLLGHHNGLSGEVGHIPLPAHLVAQLNLPILGCGCGRTGCYETLLSGPGMSRLCEHMTGVSRSAMGIVEGKLLGDTDLKDVFDCWLTLLCELLHTIELVIDPDCIVLGGGLSRIDQLAAQLSAQFPQHQLPGLQAPQIRCARFGDSSGVRGAAMLAQQFLINEGC